MNNKVRKLWFWSFFLVSYSVDNFCRLIVRCLTYLIMCCIEILYTITLFIYCPISYDQQNISDVGASRRRKLGVGLACHKMMSTKPHPGTNNWSFHTEQKKQPVYNLSIPRSDWISIWFAQPAACSLTLWQRRTGCVPLHDPVASKGVELTCCVAGFVYVDYFGLQNQNTA